MCRYATRFIEYLLVKGWRCHFALVLPFPIVREREQARSHHGIGELKDASFLDEFGFGYLLLSLSRRCGRDNSRIRFQQ
jgi:hypothetical protein